MPPSCRAVLSFPKRGGETDAQEKPHQKPECGSEGTNQSRTLGFLILAPKPLAPGAEGEVAAVAPRPLWAGRGEGCAPPGDFARALLRHIPDRASCPWWVKDAHGHPHPAAPGTAQCHQRPAPTGMVPGSIPLSRLPKADGELGRGGRAAREVERVATNVITQTSSASSVNSNAAWGQGEKEEGERDIFRLKKNNNNFSLATIKKGYYIISTFPPPLK